MKRNLLSACALVVFAGAAPLRAQVPAAATPAAIPAALQPAFSATAVVAEEDGELGRARVSGGRVLGGVAIGAGVGAVAGALIGRFAVSDDADECDGCLLDFDADDRTLMGAVWGGGAGAILGGVVVLISDWNSDRGPVAVSRAPAGGTAVSMRLTF